MFAAAVLLCPGATRAAPASLGPFAPVQFEPLSRLPAEYKAVAEKTLYETGVEGLPRYEAQFALVDLDGDGVFELILQPVEPDLYFNSPWCTHNGCQIQVLIQDKRTKKWSIVIEEFAKSISIGSMHNGKRALATSTRSSQTIFVWKNGDYAPLTTRKFR